VEPEHPGIRKEGWAVFQACLGRLLAGRLRRPRRECLSGLVGCDEAEQRVAGDPQCGLGLEAGVVDEHFPGRAVPIDPRTLVLKKGDELFQVGDVGNVAQSDRLIGQQGGAEDRKDGVLVARRDDGAGQRPAAIDNEISHEKKAPAGCGRLETARFGTRFGKV